MAINTKSSNIYPGHFEVNTRILIASHALVIFHLLTLQGFCRSEYRTLATFKYTDFILCNTSTAPAGSLPCKHSIGLPGPLFFYSFLGSNHCNLANEEKWPEWSVSAPFEMFEYTLVRDHELKRNKYFMSINMSCPVEFLSYF